MTKWNKTLLETNHIFSSRSACRYLHAELVKSCLISCFCSVSSDELKCGFNLLGAALTRCAPRCVHCRYGTCLSGPDHRSMSLRKKKKKEDTGLCSEPSFPLSSTDKSDTKTIWKKPSSLCLIVQPLKKTILKLSETSVNVNKVTPNGAKMMLKSNDSHTDTNNTNISFWQVKVSSVGGFHPALTPHCPWTHH